MFLLLFLYVKYSVYVANMFVICRLKTINQIVLTVRVIHFFIFNEKGIIKKEVAFIIVRYFRLLPGLVTVVFNCAPIM